MSPGLLLYNGQLGEDTGADYLALGMHDRRADFRFNLGNGPAVIVSEPMELNQWHTIRIKRNQRSGQHKCIITPQRRSHLRLLSGTLEVNGREYTGEAPGINVGLDLVDDLYVGAVPEFRLMPSSAGHNQGFVGLCSVFTTVTIML
jgi:hypothetical protein